MNLDDYMDMVERLKSKNYRAIAERYNARAVYNASVFATQAFVQAQKVKRWVFFGADKRPKYLPMSSILYRNDLSMDEFDTLHAALGLITESVEFMEAWSENDRESMLDELGDIMWHVALAAGALGVSLEEVMELNNVKLEERYGDSFSEEKWAGRDKEAEKKAQKRATGK